MCTVTYLPLRDGFIITSNRDEIKSRAAALPKKYIIHSEEVYFPKDPLANGTWFASSKKYTLCLLNGAFVKHKHNPPYRLSRGLVLLDFFKFNNTVDYINSYNFNGIENFTLIIKSHQTNEFNELRWDGTKLHLKELEPGESYLWASCTLYTDEIVETRKKWFNDWLQQNQSYNQSSIMHFHRFAGDGDLRNDIVMKRENELQTVSITSLAKSDMLKSMQYIDLINNTEHSIQI